MLIICWRKMKYSNLFHENSVSKKTRIIHTIWLVLFMYILFIHFYPNLFKRSDTIVIWIKLWVYKYSLFIYILSQVSVQVLWSSCDLCRALFLSFLLCLTGKKNTKIKFTISKSPFFFKIFFFKYFLAIVTMQGMWTSTRYTTRSWKKAS